MVKSTVFSFVLIFSLSVFLISCEEKEKRVKVGYGSGYLFASVYAARENVAGQVDVEQFGSLSDVAYALLSDKLDAGFIEAEKLAALSAIKGFEKLTVVGKVTYPYGATFVLRKGLGVRLHELGEITVAVSSANCVLLKEFTEDALRLGADISGIKFKYMAFNAMLPALETGVVDAVIIKGTYSIVALQEGHAILYQNWDVKPGDDCCPVVIDQAALVLLARRSRLNEVKPFVDALISTEKLSPDQLRRAVADNSIIPFEILKGQPVPEFSAADDELVEIFNHAEEHHDGDDHDE